MEYACTSKRISIGTWMRELNRVFFEKSKWQLLGNSVLLALLDIFLNVKFPKRFPSGRSFFENKLTFFILE